MDSPTYVNDAATAEPNEMQKFVTISRRFYSTESRLAALNFVPRASDVIIATPPKSGTTWMQQIVHGLRTGGSMDFDEISEVIPYLEMASDLDQDILADQVVEPRAFKTHLCYDHCPKDAGHYIVIVRNPLDVFPSYFAFFHGWLFPEGAIDMNTMLNYLLKERNHAGKPNKLESASVFYIIESWWRRSTDKNVLFLFYEDMVEDLGGTVKTVAEFIGCGAGDAELQELVAKQASKEFMLANVSKFDAHLTKKRNKALGLPDDAGMGSGNAVVRAEKDGKRRADLSAEIAEEINKRWKPMEELTGCSSYEAFRLAHGAGAKKRKL